jgi:hypothetical protein
MWAFQGYKSHDRGLFSSNILVGDHRKTMKRNLVNFEPQNIIGVSDPRINVATKRYLA